MAQQRSRVALGDGTVLFLSYDTVIGFRSPRIKAAYTQAIYTDRKYSRTTGKHRNTFIREHGGQIIPHQTFEALRKLADL